MTMRPGYGDVLSEYRALTTAAALVQGAHDVVWVEGPDATSFLQGILSQDVEGMAVGGVARSFFLAPQGKLQAVLWLAKGADRVAIVVDAGHGANLVEQLSYYRIRVKSELRLETRDIWEVWGPDATEVTKLTSADRWEESDDRTLIPIPMTDLPRVLVIGPQPASGLPMAGSVATAAVRVERLEPVYGLDVDEKTIPQETGLSDESVSFTKGCYLGQELVARIDSRGHVNRRLRNLAITRNVLPPEGAGVYAGEREVGSITSVSESLVSPVGMVLLRREVEDGAEVTVRWDEHAVPAIVGGGPS